MKRPEWLSKFEYPFTSHFLTVGNEQLHYIDEGAGRTVVFVHGTPSWSFDFRNVISRLIDDYRCIALDHIGFGLSDKPENYTYSLQHHIQNLETLVNHLELEKITLVVHDFGGPIGLAFAEKYPDKIEKIVVLNSWMWSFENEPEFKKLKRILGSPILPFLYRYFNFSARAILPSSFGKNKPDRAVLRNYTKPFANRKQRNGTVGFAKSLLHDQHFFDSLWRNKQSIENKPVLLIWGMLDKFVRPKYLDKFRQAFHWHQVLEIPTAGHFPQEENPELVAAEIALFAQQ